MGHAISNSRRVTSYNDPIMISNLTALVGNIDSHCWLPELECEV